MGSLGFVRTRRTGWERLDSGPATTIRGAATVGLPEFHAAKARAEPPALALSGAGELRTGPRPLGVAMYLGFRYPLSFGLYRVSVTAHQNEPTSVLGRRYTESIDRIEFQILKPSAFSWIASVLDLFTPCPTPSIPDDRLSSYVARSMDGGRLETVGVAQGPDRKVGRSRGMDTDRLARPYRISSRCRPADRYSNPVETLGADLSMAGPTSGPLQLSNSDLSNCRTRTSPIVELGW